MVGLESRRPVATWAHTTTPLHSPERTCPTTDTAASSRLDRKSSAHADFGIPDVIGRARPARDSLRVGPTMDSRCRLHPPRVGARGGARVTGDDMASNDPDAGVRLHNPTAA